MLNKLKIKTLILKIRHEFMSHHSTILVSVMMYSNRGSLIIMLNKGRQLIEYHLASGSLKLTSLKINSALQTAIPYYAWYLEIGNQKSTNLMSWLPCTLPVTKSMTLIGLWIFKSAPWIKLNSIRYYLK